MIDRQALRNEARQLTRLPARQLAQEAVFACLVRGAESRQQAEKLQRLDEEMLRGLLGQREPP